MSTLEATVSMLESMPEEAQEKVYEFTHYLFAASKSNSPFSPLTMEDILTDLQISRNQIENGEAVNMKSALKEMGRQHGFI